MACQRIDQRIRHGLKRRGRPFDPHKPSLRRVDRDAYLRFKRAHYHENKDAINKMRREKYAELQARRRGTWDQLHEALEALPRRRAKPDPETTPKQRHKPPRKTPVPRNLDEYIEDTYGEALVPVEPFRKWLTKYSKEVHITTLAEAVGKDESVLRRILNNTVQRKKYRTRDGEVRYSEYYQKNVTIDLVDRCLIAAGGDTMLWELYPLD